MKQLYIYLRFTLLSFSYILLALLLIFGAYLYSIPQLEVGSHIIYNYFYKDLGIFPEWVYIVHYIIFIFLVITIIIICWTIRYSVKKKRKKMADKIFVEKFTPQLFDYLFSEEEYSDEEKKKKLKELRSNIKSDHIRRTLINTLREIHAETVGKVNEKTKRLFNVLQFDYLINAYLLSLHIKDKIFAIKTISAFNLSQYEAKVLKLTKSNNLILRSEAIVAMMHLNAKNSPLNFVFSKNYVPTLWDINLIVKTTAELDVSTIDYARLINSEEDLICLLGIMLAKRNNQTQFKKLISSKLDNPNKMISDEAFQAYIYFAEEKVDYDELIDKFIMASNNLQIEIIKSLKYSPDIQSAIKFLKWVVENQKVVQKVEALKSLFELDFNTILYYKNSENEQIRKSCSQILDINL